MHCSEATKVTHQNGGLPLLSPTVATEVKTTPPSLSPSHRRLLLTRRLLLPHFLTGDSRSHAASFSLSFSPETSLQHVASSTGSLLHRLVSPLHRVNSSTIAKVGASSSSRRLRRAGRLRHNHASSTFKSADLKVGASSTTMAPLPRHRDGRRLLLF